MRHGIAVVIKEFKLHTNDRPTLILAQLVLRVGRTRGVFGQQLVLAPTGRQLCQATGVPRLNALFLPEGGHHRWRAGRAANDRTLQAFQLAADLIRLVQQP